MNLRKTLALSLLIRLLVIPFFYHPDIKSQYFHFQFLSKGVLNIYEYIEKNNNLLPYKDTFNYLPLTYFTFGSYFASISHFVPANLTLWLNDWSDNKDSYPDIIYFLIYLKLPYLFADILIAFLLYKLYDNQKIMFYWLFNPISIYLIYILGNFDVIPAALTLLSYYLLSKNKHILSFLILGLAVAIKLYPLIFLPFYIFYLRPKIGSILKYSVITILPLIISLIPFLNSQIFWHSFFSSGLTQKILEIKMFTIPVFPSIYSVILLIFIIKNKSIETTFLYLFILFVSFVNFHPQWIIWFLPFFILIYVKNPQSRISLISIFILIFLYISLFNDQYLFWGHLVPIDPEFPNAISPYQVFTKYSPITSTEFRQYLHYLIFVIGIISINKYELKK